VPGGRFLATKGPGMRTLLIAVLDPDYEVIACEEWI
jgi:hypothetical protein